MLKFRLLIILAAFAFATPTGTWAKTPDHVYQVVGVIESKVRAMLAADFIEAGRIQEPAALPRLPRHVFAKLVEVAEKVTVARRLNGLGPFELALPAKPIEPAVVFEAATRLGGAVDELLAVYDLPMDAFAPEPMSSGKTPGDVYARLTEVTALLALSHQPPTVPNDVYRVADTVFREAKLLAETFTGQEHRSRTWRSKNKSPADVYELTRDLSDLIGRLMAKAPYLAPRGGMFAPQEREGVIRPAHVRDALNLLLADLVEIRVKSGASTPIALSPTPVGKTPSSVFASLTATYRLLHRLDR